MLNGRNENRRRYRNAREDAKIGSIEKRIDQDYGLPKGSVQINRSVENNARSDKKLAIRE